jgi:hypothetical protein
MKKSENVLNDYNTPCFDGDSFPINFQFIHSEVLSNRTRVSLLEFSLTGKNLNQTTSEKTKRNQLQKLENSSSLSNFVSPNKRPFLIFFNRLWL